MADSLDVQSELEDVGEVIRFGEAELRLSERQLRINGSPAALSGRAFDLVVALARRPGRVVSKNDLMDIVWPGLVVEENNLQVHISALRKLLGPHVIATVPGRGYQFTAAIEGHDVGGADAVALQTVKSADAKALLPGNIAPEPVVLIGRDEELRRLLEEIETHRLVSVVGAAGMGKTTLALAAAQALKQRWEAGVWFVALGPVTDPSLVPTTIGQALRLSLGGSGSPLDVLSAALEGQNLLLVLDNCEHLVVEVAEVVSALLQRAPQLRVLATSQELLNLGGEKVFKLGPLHVPGPGTAAEQIDRDGAMRLFAERAQLMDPRFSLRPDNAETVAEICRHLDGLPLAIELAAARVRLLGVDGLLELLGERFRVLTGGARSAMRRHQTLSAAFEWSFGLLSTPEQTVFRRLGVFSGGFNLDLVQHVARDAELDKWDVLDVLGALVDKSLVSTQEGSTPRYALLETARAFALGKLAEAGETPALLERHARTLLAEFEAVHELRHGENGILGETGYVGRLAPEIDNLRAALAWSGGRDGDATVETGLAAASAELLMMSGLSAEALEILKSAAARSPEAAGPERATRFWAALCIVGIDRGVDDRLYETALERAEHGSRQLGWHRCRYRILLQKCWRRNRQWQLSDAEATLAQAIEIEQADWPAWLRSDRLNAQAELANYRGDSVSGIEMLQQASALLEQTDEQRRRSRCALNIAVGLNILGDWNQAADRLATLIDEAEHRVRSTAFLAWAYGHLVMALLDLDRLDEARARIPRGLSLWRADGTMQLALLALPRLAIAQGRVDVAMRLMGAESSPDRFSPLARRFREETLRQAAAAESSAARRERWMKEGASLTPDAVVRICVEIADGSTGKH